jgi:beta-N-acetylhexosaminidase
MNIKNLKLFILIFFLNIAFTLADTSDVNIFTNQNDPWVENILSGMTLEQKAGQLVFPHAYGRYMSIDSPEYQRLVHLVENVKVGGIIFFLSNIYDQAIVTNKLQEIADIPLLISADFERGVAQRAQDATLFPYNMGIGAADDLELTYEMGKIIAIEGGAIGVHHNYAPVSDVNNNPFNPIINVRAYGEDVDLVERLSNSFLKGVQDGGMIATSKHFPGHGNTDVDSHRDLPLIAGARSELKNLELAPFQSNIDNGVLSFMIGHLEVPAYEPVENLPSTLSQKIVTDLLQEEMGFKGLIVTDAMNMHAITNSFSTAEATVMALLAGNDCILFPDDAEVSVNAIIAAVKKGDISEKRLNHSVRKILLAKKWAKLDKKVLIDINKISENVGIKSHWKVAEQLARKSITLVKDEDKLIPLSLNTNLKYAHISLLDSRFGGEENFFNRLISARVNSLSEARLSLNSSESDFERALEIAENADVIILSTYLKVRAFEGDLGLNEMQAKLVRDILELDRPVVFCSHGNPYIIAPFPGIKTYLCNYGDTEVSEMALAEALFGEIEIQGKLPISIPNTQFVFGSGIKLNKTALLDQSNIFSTDVKRKFKQVDDVIESAISDTAFPGAVLLIAKDGEIIHKKAFGNFTYDYDSQPVNTNTIFDLASVSKVVATTTAAMICMDKGFFKLDDKVSKFIPEFAQNGKEHVTIKNLLIHNSGLVSWKKFYETMTTGEEILNDIYSSKLEYKTGTKMLYSDWGMITLQKIIEKITGKSLDIFTKDEIFAPLGMTNTMYNPPLELKHKIMPTEFDNYWRMRQLQGEVHDEAASLLNGVAGHAGLFSTAGDLAKFLQMLLQKGNYNGRQIIKPETVELFIKKDSELSTRALGWDTKSPKRSSAGTLYGLRSYGHTGYTGTSVWTDPDRNLFVVLLTNRVYPTRNNSKLIQVRPKLHDAVINAIEN